MATSDFYYTFIELMEKKQTAEVVYRRLDGREEVFFGVPESHNFTHFRFFHHNWRLPPRCGSVVILPMGLIISLEKFTHADFSKLKSYNGMSGGPYLRT